MRKISFFALVCLLAFAAVSPAHAAKSWGWWPSNWKTLDFQPYLGGEKLLQRGLWDRDTWTPQAWIKDAGASERIIRDFYAYNIIRDQYTDSDNIPVMVVGDNFMKLSGTDRRRVMEFIDYVFEITKSEPDGMFYVYNYQNMKEPIGVWNKYGFQQN